MDKVWYFTFGCDHPLAQSAQPIRAKSAWHARLKMLNIYGQKWCGQYDEAQFRGVNAKYGPFELLKEMACTEDEAVDIASRMGVPA